MWVRIGDEMVNLGMSVRKVTRRPGRLPRIEVRHADGEVMEYYGRVAELLWEYLDQQMVDERIQAEDPEETLAEYDTPPKQEELGEDVEWRTVNGRGKASGA